MQMDVDVVGAIKIKDGLFIGDEFAAQDLEFVITNKVTHIINCAGRQVPNFWESIGVSYLTYNWADSDNQILFDQRGDVVSEIFSFAEEALANGESTLVHSVKGQSRSCCVIAAYFMKRFKWSLYKTLEFLTSRRPDLEIRASFYHQLTNLEARIIQENGGAVSANWYDMNGEVDNDELLLRNTFLNAKNAPLDEELINPRFVGELKTTINWTDIKAGDKSKIAVYFTHNDGKMHKPPKPKTMVKSILKGSNKIFKLTKDENTNETSASKPNSQSGLRMNKSLKTLHEDKASTSLNSSYSTLLKKTVPNKVVDFNEQQQPTSKHTKYNSNQNLPRSSSASTFEREDLMDKDHKISNLNGNIIHVTVNNYIAPLNNVNNIIQPGSYAENHRQTNENAKKQDLNDIEKFRVPLNTLQNNEKKDHAKENNELLSNESYNKILNDPNADKNSLNYLAARQLKLALEKKLSKEYSNTIRPQDKNYDENRLEQYDANGDISEPHVNSTTKPGELKLTYLSNGQQKRGETPPPRTNETKKSNESVYTKALAKTSLSQKPKADQPVLTTSTYFQNLFPSTLMQLSSLTPSAPTTTQQIEKKGPSSTKATSSSTYNFGPYKSQMNIPRPQSSHLSSEKSNSLLEIKQSGSFLNNLPSQSSQSIGMRTQLAPSNSQVKQGPIKVDHSKVDRPRSANLNRSTTPNPSNNMPGRNEPINYNTADKKEANLSISTSNKLNSSTSSQKNSLVGMNNLRSFSPSVKSGPSTNISTASVENSFQIKNQFDAVKLRKESPTSQNAPGNYRQRSSSPSQNPNFNLMFSASSSKPRWKF